jgi:hypothetical protein
MSGTTIGLFFSQSSDGAMPWSHYRQSAAVGDSVLRQRLVQFKIVIDGAVPWCTWHRCALSALHERRRPVRRYTHYYVRRTALLRGRRTEPTFSSFGRWTLYVLMAVNRHFVPPFTVPRCSCTKTCVSGFTAYRYGATSLLAICCLDERHIASAPRGLRVMP